MEMKIRMSDELYLLVLRTAGHTALDCAEVLRRAIRSYVNKRHVAPIEINERCYKAGSMVMTVKNVDEKVEANNDLRLFIARRCTEVLFEKNRIRQKTVLPARPPETLEEAEKMICYIEG